MNQIHLQKNRQAALRIVAIYALVAAAWILLSDHALFLVNPEAAFPVHISVAKGFLFIVVTSLLLYRLISTYIRKAACMKEELHARQNFIDAFFEQTTDLIFVKDRQSRYLLFNAAGLKFAGKTLAEVIGKDDTELFSAEDASAILAQDQRIMRDAQVVTFEEQVTGATGSPLTFHTTKGPIFDADGTVTGLFGIARDITIRKQAEQKLLASEQRFHKLFDHMLEGFAYCQMLYDHGQPVDFIYLAVNDSFGRLTGLTEATGKKVSVVIPGIRQTNPEVFEIYGRVAAGGGPEQFETFVQPLGHWFSISVYSPEKGYFVAVFDVITLRKQAEDAQKNTIELLRLCNSAGNLKELMHGLMIYFQRVTGCEAIGVRLRDGVDFPYYETRGFSEEFVLAESQLCAMDRNGELIRDRAGHPALDCMCGNIICGRFDPGRSFFTEHGSFWSSCTTELLATTTDEDRQAKTRNRCHGEGYESVALVPLRTQGKTFGLFQFNDRRRGRFTAEKIARLEELVDYVAMTMAKLQTDEALKKSEEQLRHAQKLEALGTLAGGVAHDFNNLLGVMVGYGGMIELRMPTDDPNLPLLREILAASDRATHLTQSLLIFSRKQVAELKPIRINDLILGMKKMVLRIIGEDIDTRLHLDPEQPMVLGDYGQLEQVLMNFATNARDAMPEGGSLTIATKHLEMDAGFVGMHGFGKPGPYVLVSVSDTGKGIDKEDRERIFEPFFTTKGPGKGTGLGLSIVYGIVKQHNGFINCYSEPGRGTTFNVYLPILQGEFLKAKETELAPVQGGDETILVADDEESIRKLTKDLLEGFGYTVILASDGVEAVQLFLANKDKIDLVLLDVIMPQLSGKEAFDRMRASRPQIKALFISGYSEDVISRKGILTEQLPLLQKPVHPRQLLTKVRELLDGNG